MAFPPDVAEQALLACARYCCLCHKFCGNKIETHHILQGGPDTLENCIPLCFDCHADVGAYNAQHPRGRKFSATELRGHRDRWYQLVKSGKYLLAGGFVPGEKADLRYAMKSVGSGRLPVIWAEVINTGACPLYIKQVSLGWQLAGDKGGGVSLTLLETNEDWKMPLPPGLNREYHGSIEPLLFSHGTEFRPYRDVWISVETPKGEIQKVVGLAGMFSPQLLSMLQISPEMHVVGEYLYPTRPQQTAALLCPGNSLVAPVPPTYLAAASTHRRCEERTVLSPQPRKLCDQTSGSSIESSSVKQGAENIFSNSET
jgi:hypothetical protein